jgi:hypothetical protein
MPDVGNRLAIREKVSTLMELVTRYRLRQNQAKKQWHSNKYIITSAMYVLEQYTVNEIIFDRDW